MLHRRAGTAVSSEPRTRVPVFQWRTTEDCLQNSLQFLSMWAAKKSGEPCQRSAHTLLPEQPQLTPVLWVTSPRHSKGRAAPTTATQLPPSHSWGTEITERKFNHLLWFPLCGGKKSWARKHRWTHNWLLISAKGSSNCLHIRATSLTVHDGSTELLYQQKETSFCHSIRH